MVSLLYANAMPLYFSLSYLFNRMLNIFLFFVWRIFSVASCFAIVLFLLSVFWTQSYVESIHRCLRVGNGQGLKESVGLWFVFNLGSFFSSSKLGFFLILHLQPIGSDTHGNCNCAWFFQHLQWSSPQKQHFPSCIIQRVMLLFCNRQRWTDHSDVCSFPTYFSSILDARVPEI